MCSTGSSAASPDGPSPPSSCPSSSTPVSAGADRQQQKRFLVVSLDVVTWDLAIKHLRETRPPALRNRLPSLADAATLPVPLSANDTTHTKEALGIMEYITWRKMFDDTVDALLEAEKACA